MSSPSRTELVCDSSWRSVIGRSGKAGLRRLHPSVSDTSLSRSSRPCSTSFITPIATTNLLIDAMRTGSSGVTVRPVAGSATPSAKAPSSCSRSKATPTVAADSGECAGVVAQADSASDAATKTARMALDWGALLAMTTSDDEPRLTGTLSLRGALVTVDAERYAFGSCRAWLLCVFSKWLGLRARAARVGGEPGERSPRLPRRPAASRRPSPSAKARTFLHAEGSTANCSRPAKRSPSWKVWRDFPDGDAPAAHEGRAERQRSCRSRGPWLAISLYYGTAEKYEATRAALASAQAKPWYATAQTVGSWKGLPATQRPHDARPAPRRLDRQAEGI